MPPPGEDVIRAYERCRAFARRRGSSFYLAFRILPPSRRRAIYAAYAFAGAVDDAVDGAGGEDERRRELERAAALLDAAYAAEHDPDEWLAAALGDAVRRYGIPRAHFDELVAGMEQDLAVARYPTRAALEQYCYRAASVIGLICIEIFGYDPADREAATELAIAMGKALQVTNILRDVREDAERGRIYLAQEDLARHGVSEADVLAGEMSPRMRRLLAEYAQWAHALYREGERLLPLLPHARSRMCCNGLQGVYRMILDAIEDADYDVFSGRISPSKAGRAARLAELWARAALMPR